MRLLLPIGVVLLCGATCLDSSRRRSPTNPGAGPQQIAREGEGEDVIVGREGEAEGGDALDVPPHGAEGEGEAAGAGGGDAPPPQPAPPLPTGEGEGEVDPPGPRPIPAGNGPLSPRAANRTCAIPAEPLPDGIDVEPLYPRLSFSRPLWFGYAPDGSDRRFVLEQDGRIRVFDDDDNVGSSEVFLDLSVNRSGNEEGLLGLAFHPGYAENRRFFVYYSSDNPRRSVVSEFRRSADNPRRADPGSQRVVLEVAQPASNHNGGDIHFGPDGYLYITLGDGGRGGDPWNNANRPSRLLGSMLRIDVDVNPDDLQYGVPADNPFVDGRTVVAGDDQPARPEVWAYGLRNAWRFSFDRDTGDLWAGDVGQGIWEEVTIVRRGEHHGWNTREGFECYAAQNCRSDGLVEPVLAYGHGLGKSITGGWVWRAPRLPELRGAYLFADYDSGRIWALRAQDRVATAVVELADTNLRITSFGQQPDGEVVVVAFNGDQLYRFVRRQGQAAPSPFPERLSDTGCFDDLRTLRPAAGVIPYSLNAPFWSDGADKRRWFALPDGTTMRAGESPAAAWQFPEGSVLIKHFDYRVGDASRRLETRLLVRREERWQGYLYKWNDEQTDAVLQEGREVADVAVGGRRRTWEYPSKSDCDSCHVADAGGSLGFRTAQLNRWRRYGEVEFPQIEALVRAGYVDLAAPSDELPAWVPDDPRVALDVNCAMCHFPDGPGNARIDLRAGVSLADSGTCDVQPAQGHLGLGDAARIIAPGDPDRSILLERMKRRGEGQMPPLATHVVDAESVALIERWITGLQGCP